MATTASQHGITWTWVEDVPVYSSVLGDPIVHAPDGITITSISPTSTQDPVSGRVINGSMLNPVASTGTTQGFDSRCEDCSYQSALNAARPGGSDLDAGNPRFVAAGSSLVSSRSRTTPGVRPQMQDIAVLTVVADEPPADCFRPGYCNPSKAIPAVAGDIDYGVLPSLAKPSGATWPSDLSALTSTQRLARPWIEILTQFNGEYIRATNNQPSYGRDMAEVTQAAINYCMLDYSNAQKANVLYGLIQYGIDIYGALVSGTTWPANGGHNMGRKFIVLLAGKVIGDAAMVASVDAGSGRKFQDDFTTFYVDQSLIDRTQNNTLGSSQWNPNLSGSPVPMRYSQDMLGIPEWGINHNTRPSLDNAHWTAIYRTVSFSQIVGQALAAHLMGLTDEWGWPAYFDYMDRYFFVESSHGVFGGTNGISLQTKALWDAYRTLPGHGPVWGASGQIATIRQNGESRTVEAGQPTTFTIVAYGNPAPTFQWRKNGTNISGATGTSYTIPSVVGADAGNYDCVVTNSFGSVYMYPATLTVTGTDPEDTTPPVFLTGPIAANITETTAEIRATLNESGTLYWLMLADGATAPSSADVEAGTGGIASGSVAAAASTLAVAPVTGGTASTARDVWVVAKDALGNLQASPVKVDITFADADPGPGPSYPGIGVRSKPGGRRLLFIDAIK